MKIFIYDEFNPEDTAMLQALYSRSAASVTEHVAKVRQSGSGKFMEKYYVGYGHASIADCGSATIFLEGVSMLVAKAVQDWPLYSGQETSSRYMDLSRQPIIDPVGTPASRTILDGWMEFYTNNQTTVAEHLKIKYSKRADEDEAVYERAIKARTFDILRGFLPAGVTTQLSWHTNLRQAWDKLALLRYWPLPEVQAVAREVHQKLRGKYQSSFSHQLSAEQERYWKFLGAKHTFYLEKKYRGNFTAKTNIKPAELNRYRGILRRRPPKTNLPHFLSRLGHCTFDFLLDFGSFRDIHRHRNGVCRMPFLTTRFGFNQWYLEQLPEALRLKAKKLIAEQKIAIAKLKVPHELTQYYIAMGFNVTCQVSYGLPATVYVVELRSGKMVHPTLRRVAHKMDAFLRRKFPALKLYSDLDPDDWDIRRGRQDIKEKP
ncbi:MAG: FAD-dependent thymidylate synthase [Candidatus Vogelbacteria bacterium]|nr:FAD-dependent thymidylate synthase [Candidatus Vogelbacteria bacterium]